MVKAKSNVMIIEPTQSYSIIRHIQTKQNLYLIEITISGKTTSRVGTQGKVVEDRSFPSNEWRNL